MLLVLAGLVFDFALTVAAVMFIRRSRLVISACAWDVEDDDPPVAYAFAFLVVSFSAPSEDDDEDDFVRHTRSFFHLDAPACSLIDDTWSAIFCFCAVRAVIPVPVGDDDCPIGIRFRAC